jgi:3-phosphoshikimate 1-carboxyvinyltransferase
VALHFTPARAVRGTIRVPGDKSVTHRAYLLAAVADGVSRIRGANPGADCAATLAAIEALGARVSRDGADAIAIAGRPGALTSPPGPLDLANAGTGMRLLAGLVAGRNVAVTLVGDASLSARPMGRIVEPLVALGARITATGPRATPPLVVLPVDGLVGVTWRPPVASAQVKSTVLLAGLVARGATRVIEPAPTRDHTERLLPAFGVACARPDALTSEITGRSCRRRRRSKCRGISRPRASGWWPGRSPARGSCCSWESA